MENKNKIRTFWDWKSNKNENIEPQKKKKIISNIYLILVVA